MAAQLTLAVAGSGKTRLIVDSIDPSRRTLLLTYTIANAENLERRIIKRFGYFPNTIHIKKYFSFIYGFCYQPFLQDYYKTRGLIFERAPIFGKGFSRWITRNGYIYSNRFYHLINEKVGKQNILDRLHKFYDDIYVDEVQDFSGHDFDFIETLAEFEGNVLCVGDFYQHTFDTSTDGSKNGNLHNSYDSYLHRFKRIGFKIDVDSLVGSWRCSSSLCAIVTEMGININSNRTDTTEIKRIENLDLLKEVCLDNSIIKLFYSNSKKHEMWSMNWGASKGIDHFTDVCIFLNPVTNKLWDSKKLKGLNNRTKCKLYVAMTRTRGTLYVASESILK